MWQLLKYLVQLIFFFIWILTLIYLICLSIFIWILFNICLCLFLFWLIWTLIGWTIALIPILKYVFVPWYRRQCQLWTQKQHRRLSVAFFHPNSKNDIDQERILWTLVQSILEKSNDEIQVIIYTGDYSRTSEEIFQSIKQHFDINLEVHRSSITFIHLYSRFLLNEKNYKILPLLGSHIGSILVGFEALVRFIPDIYIDSIGYPWTYPCFYYLASIPIISYVHHPAIQNDRIDQALEQYTTSALSSKLTMIYYEIFTSIYAWCAQHARVIFCNSSSTKTMLESTWKSSSIILLYPPCEINQFVDSKDVPSMKSLVSIGQFRLEKNHELQIRAFHQLLQKQPEYRQQYKLILMGYVRNEEDQNCVEQLQLLIDNLNIRNEVELKVNVNFKELKSIMNQGIIGLQSMRNEDFDIGIVEMMAAGLIVIAHRSGASKTNIIIHGQTGFLADDVDSYMTTIEQIFTMTDTERNEMQRLARDSLNRFNRLNFDRVFFQCFEQILPTK